MLIVSRSVDLHFVIFSAIPLLSNEVSQFNAKLIIDESNPVRIFVTLTVHLLNYVYIDPASININGLRDGSLKYLM